MNYSQSIIITIITIYNHKLRKRTFVVINTWKNLKADHSVYKRCFFYWKAQK